LLKREGSNLGAGKLYDFILHKPYRSHDLAYLLSVIKPRIQKSSQVLKPVIEFRRAKLNGSPDAKNKHPLQQLPMMKGFRSHRNVFNFNMELVQNNSN